MVACLFLQGVKCASSSVAWLFGHLMWPAFEKEACFWTVCPHHNLRAQLAARKALHLLIGIFERSRGEISMQRQLVQYAYPSLQRLGCCFQPACEPASIQQPAGGHPTGTADSCWHRQEWWGYSGLEEDECRVCSQEVASRGSNPTSCAAPGEMIVFLCARCWRNFPKSARCLVSIHSTSQYQMWSQHQEQEMKLARYCLILTSLSVSSILQAYASTTAVSRNPTPNFYLNFWFLALLVASHAMDVVGHHKMAEVWGLLLTHYQWDGKFGTTTC